MKRMAIALGLLWTVILLATASPILAGPPNDPPSTSMLVTLASPASPGAFSTGATPSPFSVRGGDQIARLIPILNSLKKHGHLRGFELVSGANAVRVDAPDSEAAMLLRGMPGVAGLVPATAQNVQTARTSFRTALARSSSTVSTAGPISRRKFGGPMSPTESYKIEVSETWDDVYGGGFTAGDTVTADLIRGGSTIDTLGTTVEGNGQFWASFSSGDVTQGDSVHVTVTHAGAGSPYVDETINSVAITVNFDYVLNKVTGTVSSGDEVWVHAKGDDIVRCSGYDDSVQATLNPDGSYVAYWTGTNVYINRTASVDVSSFHEGTSSYLGWSVQHREPQVTIQLNTGSGNGNGQAIGPSHNLTITLKNALGVEKQTVNPRSSDDPGAGFGFNFDRADIAAGDKIEITEDTGGSLETWLSYTIPTLKTRLDPVTNLITGARPTSWPVTVMGNHYNRTNGNWESKCQVVAAGGSTYSYKFGVNYVAGDWGETYLDFNYGNRLHSWDNAPYLVMYNGQNIVQGNFHSNFDGELTITVKTSSGALKYSGKGYAYGGWWQQVLAKGGLPVKLLPGYKVTVVPIGVTGGTLTGTVAKVTANIDLALNKITGTAPAKAFLGVFDNYWNGWGGYNCDQCWVKVQASTTGQYSSEPFNRDLVTGDSVEALYVDATGHETIAVAYSTHPTITFTSTPPTIFRRGRDYFLTYTISGGQHVQDIYMGMDSVTRPDWSYTMRIGPNYPWWPGGPGSYTMQTGFGNQGRMYYRGFAWVDQQFIFTTPELWAPVR